ncbi:MAG: GGDEF domain-containing protein [Gammaproteobacteria bacterium]|nr:MAG: GGDEF domain-containing protein [Gammaproteobacteria bacterium]UTW43849.1 GGDEF domain-containing protein [bacterium SCSIO 12844]
MKAFQWNKNFATHITTVDQQHKKLFLLVNKFSNLISENNLDIKNVQKVYQELIDYTKYHFQEEERLMKETGIDKRHLEHHIKEHQIFTDYIGNLSIKHDSTHISSLKNLFNFLVNWLSYHVLGIDQSMAYQVQMIQTGTDAKEAYDKQKHSKDPVTELLISALESLFNEIFKQNRELQKLNTSLDEKVKLRTTQLEQANKHLEELSYTDTLTQLANRRYAMHVLADFWAKSNDINFKLTCLMIDVDYFKQINDTYGHDIGDIYLKELSIRLKSVLRKDDILCRFGGDEFFVISPNISLEDGIKFAERLRKVINDSEIRLTNDKMWKTSLSIGIAEKESDMPHYDALIKMADESLYFAKKSGRNMVKSIQYEDTIPNKKCG